MKTLILIRHSKASQQSPLGGDIKRPLSGKGIQQADQAGRWLAQNVSDPEIILCSSALRTKQTLNMISESWGNKAERNIIDALYLASPYTILEEVSLLPNTVNTVAVICHNPGLQDLAASLIYHPLNEEDLYNYQSIRSGFPTSCCAVLSFDKTMWADVKFATGHVKGLYKKGAA